MINGIAPPPRCIQNAARRKERLSGTVTQVATTAQETPSRRPEVTPAAKKILVSLPKEREELSREVKALRTAQVAIEDTWTKQIALLEDALSKYSVEGIDSPTEECRKCGSTESVGLRDIPNGRLLLCHGCGWQMARQGKEAVQQRDWALIEANRGLRAKNIALCTKVAALKKRLATVEKAVVGWGVPQHDSGYEEKEPRGPDGRLMSNVSCLYTAPFQGFWPQSVSTTPTMWQDQ
ncbi:hypothetical protein DOTSEDRAFT_87646 [Dothistroma septosporum NZE10]|uniref:GATA-type domain-containing protein n=1 Tax=Dothistroma septosporum (strain NZE10 / CBS 128990) TaxID=675120 RepID=N1PQM5_DOTSN|nr:hypothetical protein DOTSEDRAFT_87646 [Dothistroma septosporum NZE10]